jgi:hypothetical protein
MRASADSSSGGCAKFNRRQREFDPLFAAFAALHETGFSPRRSAAKVEGDFHSLWLNNPYRRNNLRLVA